MGRWLTALVAPLLLGTAPPVDTVAYTLSPKVTTAGVIALEVIVRFNADASGVTRFDWIGDWAGEEHLGQWAQNIVVDGAQSVEPAPHGGRIIHAAPNAPLIIRYDVRSAFAEDPTVDDRGQAKPIIRPTWFYAVGEALFAVPGNREHSVATFAWVGPSDIKFASDLEHSSARPGSSAKSLRDITESVVIGGRQLNIVTGDAGGAPLRVATIGDYGFDRSAFEHLARAVVTAERRFWQVDDHKPFLITMAPLRAIAGHRSASGTGRADAFALWIDASSSLTPIGWLLAHEYFHTWNPRQLGQMGGSQQETEAYWLSEGFTDFFSRRLMLHANLIAAEQFAAKWNEALASYGTSRFRAVANGEAARLYWQDYEAERLPYQRGAMLAAIWEARQRRAHRDSLDEILRDQRRHFSAASGELLVPAFQAAAMRHGLDIRADLARYLDRGEPLLLPADIFGECAAVVTTTRRNFARGYDAEATSKAGNVITGLDPSSPAYAAGLRNGMKVLRRTMGTPGDSRVPFELVVQDGAAERTIRFLPEGKDTLAVQQLILDKARFATEPTKCAVSLAG